MQRRQRVDRNVLDASHLDDALAHITRGRRDGDEQLVRAPLAHELTELGGRAEDAHAVQAKVLLAGVVVDEPDWRVAERRVPQHLAQHQLRRVSGAHDQHLLASRDDRAGGRALDDRAREQAHAHHEREQEKQVDDPGPARHRGAVEVEQREDQEGRDDGGRDAAQDAHMSCVDT